MRLFGTNGIRGKIGEEFTPEFLVKVGMAIGSYLNLGEKVILGTDTRISREIVKTSIVSGLLATGVNVVDIGIAPTPAIQLYTKNHGDFGMAITASHNPPEFNGVKCIAGDGTELPRTEEEKIEEIFFSGNFRIVPWNKVGDYSSLPNANDEYVNSILKKVDVEKIKKKEFTVVLDCANGASCFTSPYLLQKLGCRVISINCQPDGTFPGHESEPKPENLKDLVALVKDVHADLGIAHDGDADRAIFVDDKGRYLYGDKTLALVAEKIVEKRKGTVVTPVSSSLTLEEVVKKHGGEVLYTRVGAPIVARKMIEVNAIFGGEENGGLIFPEHQYCRDGGMALAKVLEIMALSNKKLSELIDALPKYHQKKLSVRCPNHMKEKILEELKKRLEGENINTTDGVKIIGDGWWVLVRPSGTEPLYRIYAEAREKEKVEKIAEEYRKILEEVIRKVEE